MDTDTVLSDFDVDCSIPMYGYLCFIICELDIWAFLDVKHVDVVEVSEVGADVVAGTAVGDHLLDVSCCRDDGSV